VSTYFDLSQPIQPGMTIYPGDPLPSLLPAEGIGEPWRVSDLRLGSHTGTHIDSASHYFPSGKNVDQYPVSRFILSGIVIPLPGLEDDQAISDQQLLKGLNDLPKGGAVLFQTGWDQYWKTDRYLRHPFLSPEAALLVIGRGASLVGIDALNVDSTVRSSEHVHNLLLGKDILIVENLAHLSALQPGRLYHFSFLPLRLAGMDGSPIRAVAWEPDRLFESGDDT
jgi:arylformamidase